MNIIHKDFNEFNIISKENFKYSRSVYRDSIEKFKKEIV